MCVHVPVGVNFLACPYKLSYFAGKTHNFDHMENQVVHQRLITRGNELKKAGMTITTDLLVVMFGDLAEEFTCLPE